MSDTRADSLRALIVGHCEIRYEGSWLEITPASYAFHVVSFRLVLKKSFKMRSLRIAMIFGEGSLHNRPASKLLKFDPGNKLFWSDSRGRYV